MSLDFGAHGILLPTLSDNVDLRIGAIGFLIQREWPSAGRTIANDYLSLFLVV